MCNEEIYAELQMSYEELVAYLVRKYGPACCDYFATPECKSKKRKISRTKEGLYCHHMDEDKGCNLGESFYARLQPFEWQLKERLVYCNILEHLILHIKICVLRQKTSLKKPHDVLSFFTTGGIFMICRDINDMFTSDGTSVCWKRRCYEEIKSNYNDYIMLLQSLLAYIDISYRSDKSASPLLSPGSYVHFTDGDYEIVELNKTKERLLLKAPTGEERNLSSLLLSSYLTYADFVHYVTISMAKGYDLFYDKIYDDILSCENGRKINTCLSALAVDYHGYGYAQYSDIQLSSDYNAENADEYISKALPMYSNEHYELGNSRPIFWNGPDFPNEIGSKFFIVRIETMFDVKPGHVPFVRYREHDSLRREYDPRLTATNNFRTSGWTELETSDIYNRKTGKRRSLILDSKNRLTLATVILTLGKDDFLLFKERYNIRHLEVLDGCYFEQDVSCNPNSK